MKCYLRVELQAADVKLSHECVSAASELSLSAHLGGEITEHMNQIAHYNEDKNMKS